MLERVEVLEVQVKRYAAVAVEVKCGWCRAGRQKETMIVAQQLPMVVGLHGMGRDEVTCQAERR